MLVIAGVTGTGTAVRFIPRPVVIGFTNGIAVLIASTQLRDVLGLTISENTGEFIDGQAVSPDGVWVRYDGEGRPPVTDGPFAETKDLIAGWMVIDVDSYERAIELAGELSAAPGAGGEPIYEWLEVRPFMTAPPTVTQ